MHWCHAKCKHCVFATPARCVNVISLQDGNSQIWIGSFPPSRTHDWAWLRLWWSCDASLSMLLHSFVPRVFWTHLPSTRQPFAQYTHPKVTISCRRGKYRFKRLTECNTELRVCANIITVPVKKGSAPWVIYLHFRFPEPSMLCLSRLTVLWLDGCNTHVSHNSFYLRSRSNMLWTRENLVHTLYHTKLCSISE